MNTAVVLIAAAVFAPTYEEAWTQAVEEGKPFVLGIGCIPPEGDWVVSTTTFLKGYPKQAVVVSVPKGGSLYWVATLGPNATTAQIDAALAPPPRKLMWNPYEVERDPKTGSPRGMKGAQNAPWPSEPVEQFTVFRQPIEAAVPMMYQSAPTMQAPMMQQRAPLFQPLQMFRGGGMMRGGMRGGSCSGGG